MRKQNIVAIVVLLIIVIELISIPINYLIKKTQNNKEMLQSIDINWGDMYPFEEEIEAIQQQNDMLEKYKETSLLIVSKVERLADYYSFFREDIVELSGAINKALGIKILKDAEVTTIALDSGYLKYLYYRNDYIANNIEDIIELDNYLEELDMEFVYCQAPSKIFDEMDIIPGCIENYRDEDKDIIVQNLKSADVDILDIRDYMPNVYEDYMSYFYITDHHWKVETGLWVSTLLASYLNKDHGFEINLEKFNLENYNVKRYKDASLGSQGKKVSLGYIAREDFSLLYPRDEQNWTVTIPEVGINETGDFELILDETQLDGDDLYNDNMYAAYIYGDQAYMSIVNNEIDDNGDKILIIGDSMNEVIVPFLATGCRQVDRIDLRLFDGSLRNFLGKNYYDVVIMILNGAGEKYDFRLHNSSWDFR